MSPKASTKQGKKNTNKRGSSNKSSPTTAGGRGTKRKSPANKAGSAGNKGKYTAATTNDSNLPEPGYLVKCDIPTKQYIKYLNELKKHDKKFILQDLDATTLLIKISAKTEIERKVEQWLDENIFSAIERVGEDFDMS